MLTDAQVLAVLQDLQDSEDSEDLEGVASAIAKLEAHFSEMRANPNAECHGKKLFLYAIEIGNLNAVRIFLTRSDLKTEMLDEENRNALDLTAIRGNVEIGRLLLARGMLANHQSDSSSKTSLHHAAANGNLGMVRFLLEEGALINLQDFDGHPPLHLAIMAKHLELVNFLLEQNADTTLEDIHGRNAQDLIDIYFAEEPVKPDLAAVEARRAANAAKSPSPTVDERPATPLTIQSDRRSSAPIKVQTRDRNDAIVSAIRTNDLSRLASYLSEKDSVNSQITHDGARYNILSFALRMDCKPETIEFILKKGADVNARNPNGLAPIHYAAMYTHQARSLLQIFDHKDIDTTATDSQGNTALHYAVLHDNNDSTALLVKRTNINNANKDGDTPLHLAARMGLFKSAKLMLTKGARSDITNGTGKTPIDVAQDYKAQESASQNFGPAKEILFQQLVDLTTKKPDTRAKKRTLVHVTDAGGKTVGSITV